MRIASFFAGEGGFDLAGDWMGWETVVLCEIDRYCKYNLQKKWPRADYYDDITKTNFSLYRGSVDLVVGGFPCQPYSTSGKRKGKEDPRHLWPEMLRAIREISPQWIVGENVLGIVNWSRGMVFDEIQSDLENEGYKVQPYVLPACGVEAPHLRYRTFFVAYSASNGYKYGGFDQNRPKEEEGEREGAKWERVWNDISGNVAKGITTDATSTGFKKWVKIGRRPNHSENGTRLEHGTERPCSNEFIADANSARLQEKGAKQPSAGTTGSRIQWSFADAKSIGVERSGANRVRLSQSQTEQKLFGCNYSGNAWEKFPTQSPICSGDDGLPSELVRRYVIEHSGGILTKKEIDKIVSQTINRFRQEALRQHGNAVVPQLVLKIYKAIDAYNNNCV